MKKILTQSAVAGVGLAFASAAFAAKPDARVAYTVMNLGGKTTTSKFDGTETGTETNLDLKTFDSGLEIAFFVPGWAIYTYPSDTGAGLAVGWAGISGLEVGPTINIDISKNEKKPKGGETTTTKSDKYTIGAYLSYALAAGSSNLELTLNPTFKVTSGETPAEGTNPKVETSGSGFGVFFDLTVPFTIAEKLEYAPGVDFTYSSNTKKPKDGKETVETETAWNLNFAKFRYTF